MLTKNMNMKVTAVAMFAMMALASGCGKGSTKNPVIGGIDGPRVSLLDGRFIMTVIFKDLALDVGGRYEIPKMPNSYVELGPDFQSNGLLLSAGLSVADIQALSGNAFELLDPLTLPGGRPLPGVADGYLPGIAVAIPKLKNMVVYIGPNVFGTFVPVNLPLQSVMASYRFYDGAGDRLGTISLVGQDTAHENSGFLLLIDIKGKVQSMMAAL